MNAIKCFDVAQMIIDEATNRFAPLWVVDNEKLDILHQYCDVIDTLIKKFDGESIDVEVDDVAMTIAITIECPDMTISEKESPYYQLIERSVSFGFSVSKDGYLEVKFVFSSIWNRSNDHKTECD